MGLPAQLTMAPTMLKATTRTTAHHPPCKAGGLRASPAPRPVGRSFREISSVACVGEGEAQSVAGGGGLSWPRAAQQGEKGFRWDAGTELPRNVEQVGNKRGAQGWWWGGQQGAMQCELGGGGRASHGVVRFVRFVFVCVCDLHSLVHAACCCPHARWPGWAKLDIGPRTNGHRMAPAPSLDAHPPSPLALTHSVRLGEPEPSSLARLSRPLGEDTSGPARARPGPPFHPCKQPDKMATSTMMRSPAPVRCAQCRARAGGGAKPASIGAGPRERATGERRSAALCAAPPLGSTHPPNPPRPRARLRLLDALFARAGPTRRAASLPSG